MEDIFLVMFNKENIFYDDFDFNDIEPILLYNILSKQQYKEIIEVTERKQQIEKLMFYLSYKNDTEINMFLKILETDYTWIIKQFKNTMDINKSDYLKYNILSVKRNLPKFSNFCIHRTKYLWDIYSKLSQLKQRQYLIIKGVFGIGKKWLAIDICSNYKIMEKMGYQILWVDVGDCTTNENILIALKTLVISVIDPVKFEDHGKIELNIKSARKKLIDKINNNEEYSKMLLVLINVQNSETLDAFDFHCKTMITTKNLTILPSLETYIECNIDDGFTLNESLELFENLLGAHLEEKFCVEILHNLCNKNPFIISLFAKFTKYSGDYNKTLNKLVESIKNKNFNIVKQENSFKNSIKAIEYIMKGLPNGDINFESLYKQLLIFVDNIPIEVLKRYWNKSDDDTENIIIQFEKLFLLEKIKDNNKICVSPLHNLIYYYLKCNVNKQEIYDMHQMLITNYSVKDVLKNRKEPDLIEFLDDDYFFNNIEYHLKKTNDKELLNLLCFDFGFLDAKLRIAKSLKTCKDLIEYKKIDTMTDQHLINELVMFLPSIEEKLIRSKHTSLLQSALSSNGLIKEKALKNIQEFPDRLWFHENTHNNNNTEIIHLPNKSTYVHFIDKNSILVALNDNSIIFIDYSLENTKESIIFLGHKSKVIDIKSFSIPSSDRINYFLSLDKNSTIIIWQLSIDKSIINKSIQTIQLTNVVSIQLQNKTPLYLYAMEREGKLHCFEWKADACSFKKRLPYDTRLSDVNSFTFVTGSVMMILSECYKINFFNIINSSKIGNAWDSKKLILDNKIDRIKSIFVNFHINEENEIIVIIVYPSKLLKVTYNLKYVIINIDMHELKNLKVTCCYKVKDSLHLVLGTDKGGYLLDLNKMVRRQIPRFKDTACSLDCYFEKDEYRLLIGLHEKNWLRLYKRLSIEYEEKPVLSSEIFDVITSDNNDLILYAIDSNNQIYNQKYFNNYELTTKTKRLTSIDNKICVMCSQNDNIYIGCENGAVYKLNEETDLYLDNMKERIISLHNIRNKYLFIATKNTYKLLHQTNIHLGIVHDLIELDDNHLLLIKTHDTLVFQIISTKDESMIIEDVNNVECDANSDPYLVLAKNIYNLITDVIWNNHQDKIIHLNLSPNNILVVGFTNGIIELYELVTKECIYNFNLNDLYAFKAQVHIKKLLFSPWTNPLILVTLTESFLCFWNVTYICNKYSSNAISSMKKHKLNDTNLYDAEVDFTIENNKINAGIHLWQNKIGPSRKEELLSCISFHSKTVNKLCINKNFTKFLTIDDFGEIYYLSVINNKINKLSYVNDMDL